MVSAKSLLTLIFIFSLCSNSFLFAQTGNIKGTAKDNTGNMVAYASVTIDSIKIGTSTAQLGEFFFRKIKPGTYTITFSSVGFQNTSKRIEIMADKSTIVNFDVIVTSTTLNEVTVNGVRTISGMGRLDELHDAAIYSGKKTEVILLDSLDANTAQNNPRQVLGRIPGANYSETEGSGFPSNGIGFRGLNPTQSIETNTRQNGYNIAADIYGYPEVYYQPPLEAVQRIEVTRGASSLQFGPQFGGVINYIIKNGNPDKQFEFITQQTAGSFGLFNSFNSIGGQKGKFNYYAFVQYKQQDGWRSNSQYKQLSGFGKLTYQANVKLKIGIEYSILRNKIKMPGGFTDEQFNEDSRASYRSRNWLKSPWNVFAATAEYKFSTNTLLSIKSAVLLSGRDLVWRNEDGGPGEADTIDPATNEYVNREVQREKFTNFTTEARLLSNYKLFGLNNTLATGARFFTGKMKRQGGGLGTTGSDFDLTLLDPHFEYSLDFTTINIAPFVENIFRVTERLSVTPGFRFEYIHSTAKGYTTDDDSGKEVVANESRKRYIPLFGIGAQYKTSNTTNIYGNISQAYRPSDYSMLTPIGVTSKIDPDLKDAKGYNADLGWRGTFNNYLNFDVSAFYLAYNNRVGLIELTNANGQPYTYRTNVANSIHKGIETYIEFRPTKMLKAKPSVGNISFFNSFSYIDARYTSGEFKGKFVEYAPQLINRFGITYSRKIFSTTFVLSNTAKSYGDANNTVLSDAAVVGVIPSYNVMDWATTFKLKNNCNIKCGINNLADKRYFTKRTDEYPGPGIIPAIGRSFYVSIGAKF